MSIDDCIRMSSVLAAVFVLLWVVPGVLAVVLSSIDRRREVKRMHRMRRA